MDASWVNAIGTWATAVGTIAVAIVAGLLIREWLVRPKLSLRCEADRPWLIDAPIVVRTEENRNRRVRSRRLRVEIRNGGRSDATNIEVHADLLYVQGVNGGQWEPVLDFIPGALRWSEYETSPVWHRIGVGSRRFVDLVHDAGEGFRTPDGIEHLRPHHVHICKLTQALDADHIQEPGTYRLTLELSASNTRATHWEVQWTYTATDAVDSPGVFSNPSVKQA